MKVLIIKDKKCFFKIQEEKSIEDITGDDIKSIIEYIYDNEGTLMDEINDENQPANPIHLEMYKNLFDELNKIINNKESILEEINSKLN